MFPYLDIATFTRRTIMPAVEVAYVEQDSPGYVATRIAIRSSYINGRLRKRYGNDGVNSSLPFGRTAPLLLASGTTPPGVTLKGTPTMGAILVLIQITTAGPLGTALFKWSGDGGVTYTTGVATAAGVVLGATGMSAVFAAGAYGLDNIYAAAPPVPEIVLGWLTTFVTYDVYRKRGINPQDPTIELLVKDVADATSELKEAADSKDGLFDLPVSEDTDSAVTTGGPLGYSETSPYVWSDYERSIGRAQDAAVIAATGGTENDG